jgi:hypothetical protein
MERCGSDAMSFQKETDMTIAKLLLASWLIVWICPNALAQAFRLYPGSKADEKAGRQASARNVQCEVYTTADRFETVYAFYKGLYQEHRWPVTPPKLPSGKEIQWAYFILDGGKDLAHSKYWVKIQRPYIGTIDEGSLDFKDIRDVTVIQTVRRN